MKTLRLIIALLLVGLALGAGAQVTKRSGNDARGKKDNKKEGGVAITDRQQSFYEVKEPHDADLQWMKVIYRSIDLTKGKNAALYYPEIPNEDGSNLYFIIMRLLANNQLAAYEYLPDGREMFTEEYRIKDVGELFTRFQLYFTEAKGSTEKNPLYEFEDADIRGNEVLCYYIIEKWEFDTRSNQMKARVEALCPVLHQEDDWSGETGRYPMFWVKLNDIRPYLAQQYVFTDDGIYAIPQCASDRLGEARLVDRTVIADGVAPVEGDGDIWLMSRHGHLCRLSGSRLTVVCRDVDCRAMAWCNAFSELWLLPDAGSPVVMVPSGAMSMRTVAAGQLYSDARHSLAVTATGAVLDLEQEQPAMMDVAWHSHPVSLDALMDHPVKRAVWHVVSDDAELSLRVRGQRGIMSQDRDVSLITVHGAIDQPLASPTMSIHARTLTFSLDGTARTGTLLLPTIVYYS